MKNVVIDIEKTLGDLLYIGCEEVSEYVDAKKTGRVKGYKYNLASTIQGEQITVFVAGDKKEFQMTEKVELIGLETKIYPEMKGKFAKVQYSLSAYDIRKGNEVL